MDDVLQSSPGEQTAQLTIEKVTLGQDPPYMEIKTKAENAYSTSVKENIPPSKWSSHQELQTNPAKEEGFGLSLPLGEEYERKKQRLQEELRQDYRRYMAQERLRNERKNECKVFHKGQNGERRMLQNMTDVSQAKVVADRPRIWAKPSEKPKSRRDAATLTESGWETPSYQRRGRRERRSWAFREERDSEPGSSEEEVHLLARRQLQARHEHKHVQKRRHRLSYRPTRRERASSADYEENYRETNRKSLSVSPKPTLQEPEPTMSSQRPKSAANNDGARFATGLMIGGTAEDHLVRQQRKDRYRQELLDQIAEQQRNKRREKELGLMVAATGAVDPDKLPNRIRQFSAVTQDRNGSRREVPNRLGLDTLHGAKEKPLPVMEERSPPERPSVAFQSPVLENSTTLPPVAGSRAAGPAEGGLSGHNEDIHKSLSSTLGEIVALRMPAIPPPVLPMLADSYRTPYDNAYYYYGARNPLATALVPSLPHGELAGSGEYPMAQVNPLPGLLPPTQQGRLGPQAQATGEADPVPGGMRTGAFPGVTAQKSNYQEALKQQIREREELRKQEEDERQNHEAKLAMEREAYNPWGRGGGGAPLRDSQGNLIADLKQMHKFNKEAYLNLNSQDKQTVLLAARTISTPEAEDQPPSPQRTSGVSFAQTSPFARGNVFPELSERQKVHGQEKYKDDLRKQIEEKRRKEAEERERLRIQEEKEEKRVAEELAKMRREYEEEQEKRRRKEMEMIRQAEEWRKQREKEKKKREEEEKKHEEKAKKREEEDKHHREKHSELSHSNPQMRKNTDTRHTSRPPSADSRCTPSVVSGENAKNENKKQQEWRKAEEENSKKEKRHSELLRLQSKREKQVWVEEKRRESSPPVPALRKRLSTRHTTRPPSAESYRAPSALSKSSVRAPQSPQEPSGRNPLKSTEEHGGVISELSVLRRLLHEKQRQLEEELLQTKDEEGDASNAISAPRQRKHHPMDVFHISRPVAVRRTPHKAAETTNLQNILDFNKLKYRDTESREEVRRLYPDPPSDDQSLDVQQQALIHEQQRGINRLRNTGSADDLLYKSKNIKNPTKDLVRSSLLTSESALFEPEEGTSQRLAREQRRLANWTDPDRELGSPKQLTGQTDFDSLHSEASLRMKEHRKQRMRRLQELKDQGWLDELDTSNEDGDLPLHTVEVNLEGRQSVDTVATEPWLRPGTSEHLKQVMTRQRHKPPSRNLSEPSWEDLPTYPS